MNVIAVVVAGGRHDGPDVLTPIGGIPMVVRSLQVLLASALVQRATLFGMDERRDAAVVACRGLPVDVRDGELRHALAPVRAHVDQRADAASGDGSIMRGSRDVVVLHDARRPLTPPALVGAVLDAIHGGHDVAVPVLPLPDTVKLVDAEGLLCGSPDRSGLRVVQTPVAFRADLLGDLAPLDAALALAAAGVSVHAVPGDPLAFAVRSAWDLELAELLAEGDA